MEDTKILKKYYHVHKMNPQTNLWKIFNFQ